MRPQYENPYWDAIVGDNWPGIDDGAWRTLESAARTGASEMDVTGFDQARRAFDEHIRVSAALQPVQDALRVEQRRLWALADALNLAADLFGEMAQLVRRTCARILDILDSAVAGINGLAVQADETEDERKDRLARIDRIIRNARDEVAAVVTRAAHQAGPQGFPELSAIAALLGIPGMGEAGNGWQPPWAPGGPGRTSWPGPKHPSRPDHGRPGTTAPQPHPDHPGVPPGNPVGDPSLPGITPIGLPDPNPDTDAGRSGAVPPGTTAVPDPNRHERPPFPIDDGHGGGTNWYDASQHPLPASQPGMVGPGPGFPGGMPNVSAPQHYSSNDSVADSGGLPPASRAVTDSPGSTAHSSVDTPEHSVPDSDTAAKSPGSDADSRADTNSSAPGPDLSGEGAVRENDSALAGPTDMGGPMPFLPLAPAAPAGATAMPQGAGAQPISAQSGPGAGSGTGANPGTGAGAAAGGAANSVPRAPGLAAAPGSTASSGPVSAAGSGAVSAPTGDHPSRNRTGRTDQRESADRSAPDHDSSAFQEAVGAAMAAAAAPAFVLGDRVDGDSALARTLLRSILAVVDCSPIAPAWAVVVTRHASGVSAFVTSNEGRGWLPAGLYLPRTVLTPWVWQAARDAAWEGVADPARVLVEFGRAWGRTSGAELSAVASSLPIDPILRAALPSVRFEGEIGPAAELNLGVPAPDRCDRLAMTASPRLLDRVMSVQEPTIALRCTELARDAHARVIRAIPDPVHVMGTPQLRQRILTALRNRAPVADDWFEELRDADDLLAAGMVSRRLDVSRIPLGELRFEENGEPAIARAIQLQRRCDELVLLLAQVPDRQCLRDAVYLHAHLIEHPAIAAAGGPHAPPRVSGL
ncbi:hypothetical protein [Nocardia sp. NPDC056100]|uniref:hypothetical protein n=1 Tax=Nocardia sp. NPDC056100 TaxID=3345712 RepID=UPI0035E13178